jgi:hypothetical protein
MNKEQTQYIDRPLIKNTGLEKMGLRIYNDEEMQTFTRLAETSTARATAHVTRKVVPVFEALVEDYERQHGAGSIELLKHEVYRAGSRRAA